MHVDRQWRYGSDELPPPSLTPPSGVAVREIPDHPDYFAGDDGHIYSAVRRRNLPSMPALRSHRNPASGYLQIQLKTADGLLTFPVHRLVALAWHGPLPDGMQTRHLDGSRTNNRPENLRYGTAQENSDDRERHGRTPYGPACHSFKIPDETVRWAVEAAKSRPQRDIARELGVSEGTVSAWVHGRKRRRALGHTA